MWGIRLFEQADTAADRRTKRTNRRRLQRRHQRIQLLQELFAEEMAKVDDTFFLRLNESKLHLEDKSVQEKYPLFIEKGYTCLLYTSGEGFLCGYVVYVGKADERAGVSADHGRNCGFFRAFGSFWVFGSFWRRLGEQLWHWESL